MDRGSREPEVAMELRQLCEMAGKKAAYSFSSFCFLEVRPPYILEGLSECISRGAEFVTVMPYFLYPGMKLKETVKNATKLMQDLRIPMAITKPLSYHSALMAIVNQRVREARKAHGIEILERECDILLIGHGSSDKRARDAFLFVASALSPQYRKVHPCFLELDRPNIEEGLKAAAASDPRVVIGMPYFLHKGAHVKTDISKDVESALGRLNLGCPFFMTGHLGVHDLLVDLVLERSREAEVRAGVG